MRSFLTLLTLASLSATAQFSQLHTIEHADFNITGQSHVSDINGDGANDILMCGPQRGIGVHINNGDGTFAELQWIDTVNYTGYDVELLAADLDGDGDQDLLARTNYTNVRYYANNGDGTFAAPFLSVDGLGDNRHMELADVNGDAIDDLVLSDYFEDVIYWYAGAGGGVFGTAQTAVTTPEFIYGVELADADGDGDPDLFTSTGSAGIHRCYTNDGVGGFTLGQTIAATGGGSRDIQFADLDGDGDLDLVSGNDQAGQSLWWANDGSGQFSTAQTIAANVPSWQTNSLGDLDGDGDLDIMPSGYGSFIPRFWCENDGSGQFATQHPLSPAELGGPSLADMDDDGDLDLVELYRMVSWYPNDGSGTMGARRMISTEVNSPMALIAADLDGDGDRDVVTNSLGGSERVVFYLNDGTGSFGLQQILEDTMYSPARMAMNDMDGDGDLDAWINGFTSVRTFANDGAANFTPWQLLAPGEEYSSNIEFCDLDGDADEDALYACWNPYSLVWYANNGSGFGPQQVAVGGLYAPEGVRPCDVDDDGDIDLITCLQGSSELIWFANDGTGQFGPQATLAAIPYYINVGEQLRCADMDNDGDQDLVWYYDTTVRVRLNLGGGSFGPDITALPMAGYLDKFEVEDLDQDGDEDVIAADNEMLAHYALNDGASNFSAPALVAGLNNWVGEMDIADMDQDGDRDIVMALAGGGGNDGVFWSESFIDSPYRIQGHVFHDVNENGAQETGEGPLPFVAVQSDPVASVPLTVPDGSYSILTDPGDYAVSVTFPNAWWGLTTSPATYNVQLTTGTPVSTGNDFGYAPLIDTTVIDLGLVGALGPCGDTTTYFLTVTNLGTTLPSGTFCGTLDTLLTIVSLDPAPTSVNGNIYCWDIDSLYYYTPFVIAVEIVNPDASMIGTLITAGVQMTELDDQGNVLQTYQEAWAAPVACSYDPNDKQVSPAGYGEAGAVDIGTERLEYTIRFQNTGNAPAENVVLVDRLAAALDPSTLQVLGYSYPPTSLSVETDGDLVIRFDGIQLPDSGTTFTGSQGFIRFAINVVPGLAHGTVIENTADIHFDLNAPVVTNTVVTTLVDCDLAEASITPSGWNALQATEGDAYQWSLNDEPIAGATGQLLFFNENGSYTCEVTTAYGCQVTTEPFAVTSTSINEGKGLRLALMPNPMSTTARLVFSEPLLPGDRVELMDVRGGEVMSIANNGAASVVIDRGALPNGVYLVRVVRAGATFATLRMAVAD